MFWDLSGDYDWYPERNGSKGEYGIGNTLTRTMYHLEILGYNTIR